MAYSSASGWLAGFFDDLVRCETRLYNAVGGSLRAEHGAALVAKAERTFNHRLDELIAPAG